MTAFIPSFARKIRTHFISGASITLALGLSIAFFFAEPSRTSDAARGESDATWRGVAESRAMESYGRLPLSFEANRGQTDPRVKFLARSGHLNYFLAETEFVLSWRNRKPRDARASALSLRWAGADPSARIEGLDDLPGTSNYLAGSGPSEWRAGVPHFARVRCRDLYPGIDLIYYGNQTQLEYDLVVRPGADPGAIRMSVTGATSLRILAGGDLSLQTASGEVRFQRPILYQEAGGDRRSVDGRYVRLGRREVGFEVGKYDRNLELVIDPLLVYSSLFSGSLTDVVNAIAVDGDGAAYVTGTAPSVDFPTTQNSYQRLYNGGPNDVFVLKLSADGTSRAYATYLGGGGDDLGYGIAVDNAGNAFVTGSTTSVNFPTTQGAYRRSIASATGSDAFIAKLNAGGGGLVYSTYLGGADDTRPDDAGLAIAIDAAGNAYVTGRMHSFDFPTTPGAFQRGAFRGDDGFVTKLNPTGSALVYSTLVAGNGDDAGQAIAVDNAGNVYLTGKTTSGDFPTTPGALQRAPGVGQDAFALKLNPAGSAAVYSTFLAGNRDDAGQAIAVDAAGQAYVTGGTASTNFLTTPGSFQPSHNNGIDAFVARLNSGGSALVYSTYLGGAGDDTGNAIAIDSAGNAYVAGATASNNFPATPNAYQATHQNLSDGFVTKLNAAGSSLLYSTFLNGINDDRVTSISRDGSGRIYVAGLNAGADFLKTTGTYGTVGGTAFIIKMSLTTPAAVNAASFAGASLAAESIVAAFGVGLATATQAATSLPLPTTLAGTRVLVTDSAGVERAAQLFFVSPGQVNFLAPPGTASGPANLTIVGGDGSVAAGTIQVAPVASGLFSANSNGLGVASGLALRIKGDGSQSFEPISRFDASQNAFVSVPIDLGPDSDRVFLILFGTGIRMRSSLSSVTATIGGVNAEVLFAGPQNDFVGLDQVNLALPRSLVGRGQVEIRSTVEGQPANTLSVTIR